MDEFWGLFGMTWKQAVAVVVSAVVIYLLLVFYVRVIGARVLSQLSTFDALVAIMLGAVAGRAVLMDVPTVGGAVLGLTTLFALELTIGRFRNHRGTERLINHRAIPIVYRGNILHQNLRRAHITDDELASSLRLAGVRGIGEVQLAAFEPNGRISVIRMGEALDEHVLLGLDASFEDALRAAAANPESPGAESNPTLR